MSCCLGSELLDHGTLTDPGFSVLPGLNVSRDHGKLAVSRKLDSGQVGTTTKSTTQRNAWQEIVRERWGKDIEVSLVNQSNNGISCLFLKGDRNCSRYWIKISVIGVSFEVCSLIPDLLLLSEISYVHYFPKSFNLLGQYFRAENYQFEVSI